MADATGSWFLAGNRGRIARLLRRGDRTVAELAEALGLTPNGVRAHLAVLQRVDLIRRTGTSPGTRKPHDLYGLTAKAERAFPKAYLPLLDTVLAVIEGLPPRQSDRLLREAGHRIAASAGVDSSRSTARQRVRRAADLIRKLGGQVETRRDGECTVLQGSGCPLSDVVGNHPGACRIIEHALAEITGTQVRERCQREGRPACRFEVRR
ncbi:MAG: helix-turn-helix transcriptional regulator [Planctomycetota bacterium]|jgi:predicted ArsR family transcriptional regulator